MTQDVENIAVDMDELEQFESEAAAAATDEGSSESTDAKAGEQAAAEAKPDEGSHEAAPADAVAGAAATDQPAGQEAQAQPDLSTVLNTVIVDHKGRQRTVQDLLTSGDIQDAITTAQQFPHLQKLYTEAIKTIREGDRPTAPQSAEIPPVDPRWTDVIEKATRKGPKGEPSLLDRAHKAGWLGCSDEFVELEPRLAAQMVIRGYQIDELLRWRAEFAQRESLNQQAQEQASFRAKVDGFIDQIADEEKVPNLRKEKAEFLRYVVENVDPRADKVNKQVMSDLLYAYLRRKDPNAFRQRNEPAKPNRAASVGGPGRAAPSAPKTGIEAELDALDEEFRGRL